MKSRVRSIALVTAVRLGFSLSAIIVLFRPTGSYLHLFVFLSSHPCPPLLILVSKLLRNLIFTLLYVLKNMLIRLLEFGNIDFFFASDPKLPSLLKMLIWAQNQLDEKATYPRINDLSTASLEDPAV